MAVVTKGDKVRPCMPPGDSVVETGVVTEDVEAGDLLILGASGWSLSPVTSPGNKRGFAAQDYESGRADCSIITEGEMDGFTGMTAGVPLFAGATGGLVDVALTGFTGRIHAMSATRIAFSL